MDLSKIYRPITANPFRNNKMYTEISPCPALAPYICCYWGTSESISTSEYYQLKNDLVIPDICMDIIINTNIELNEIIIDIISSLLRLLIIISL